MAFHPSRHWSPRARGLWKPTDSSLSAPVWFETDYSVYTMRQASRRSWRIGQTQPVQVVFMAYRNTPQADALKLVARELWSSLAVEGELPEDGLDAYGGDGDDLRKCLSARPAAGWRAA